MLALTIANIKIMARNRQTTFWALFFPLILVVVFGLFDFSATSTSHIAIIDEADTVGPPLEQPQVAVALRVHEAGHSLPVARDVDQYRCGNLVPVPGAVPVVLVIARDLAAADVESDDGVRVEIVAGAGVSVRFDVASGR